MSIKIGNLDTQKKCLIIAEAGVNHNGSIKIAEKLIKEAKKMEQILLNFKLTKLKNQYLKMLKDFGLGMVKLKKKAHNMILIRDQISLISTSIKN